MKTLKNLDTQGFNSILDFKQEHLNLIHEAPDCSECVYCMIYRGDGKNIFKKKLEHRAYCSYSWHAEKVPLSLEKPTIYNDLWLPYRDKITYKLTIQGLKLQLYIPHCVIVKKSKACMVKLVNLPESEWKRNKKPFIQTVDQRIEG